MAPQLQVAAVGDTTVVTVKEKSLDESNADAAGEELFRLVDGRGRRLHLDLGDVEHLTSTAMGKLASLQTRVRQAGGQLELHNVQPWVYELLEVTRLTQVLTVRKAEEASA
jgi:anti-anti-sigma factor